VDAEVKCTDEQAAALQARIRAWREAPDAVKQPGVFLVVLKS
jgi:hypothetical protein